MTFDKEFETQLSTLRMVDSALARRAVQTQREVKHPLLGLGRVGQRSLPAPPPTIPKGPLGNAYDIASDEIKRYRTQAEAAIKSRRRIGYDDLAVSVVTIAILVAAIFFSSVNGILASLGLSGTTAVGEVQKITTADKAFQKDAHALRGTADWLEGQLVKCGKDDKCCEKVTDMALNAMKALNEAAS